MASIYDKGTTVRVTRTTLIKMNRIARRIMAEDKRPVHNPEIVAAAINSSYDHLFPPKKRAKA